TPFPSGFDSRNYYMNISNLVAQQGELISGYPPYNGSLINAIGLLLFGQIELSLSISLSGVILVLLMSYRIAVDKLQFDKNRAAFLVALIAVVPAIVNQMYIEMKVDFMLLFFQLLAVYFLFEIDEKYISLSKPIENIKRLVWKIMPLAAFLGILLGFGMGIKMINLFLVVVMFVMMMWDRDNNWSGLGVICLGLMIFFLGGIDDISGLRKYHYNVGILSIILGLVGIILLAVGIYFHRHSTIRRILFSSVVAAFLVLTISPWVIKNYLDTGSADPKTILMGSSPGPKIGLRKMVKNYENKK
ncbi:MAG: phospholipid carrier-dependent glycosyltransferase, partial [Saprospiraceae bacterium]|nr:phospholipid carrier-dependent glycosyltransferase [Saprospiraceae bacterium]